MKLFELYTKEKDPIFQVRVERGDWKDISLGGNVTLDDIKDAVNGPPIGTYKFDISVLTSLVKKYIGDGPDGYGPAAGTWDEMDFETLSMGDDVLKIKYTFSGIDKRRDIKRKTGTITIMAT